MINKPIWLKGIKKCNYPTLKSDIDTDILIIGGGITGISVAHFLKDEDLKVVLVEGKEIASSTTARTTGKLTYLQDGIYGKILDNYSIKDAKLYLKAQREAIDYVKNIIIENNIKCNFESNSSYLFTTSSLNIPKVKREKEFLEKEVTVKELDKLPINFPCKYAIRVDNTATFNSVKYVRELSKTLKNEIYEKTRITDIRNLEDGTFIAITDKNYKIKAKKIVLALHYPFFLFPYLFPFKTSIEKSFISASLTSNPKLFNAINLDKENHSIRYYSDDQNYIIYLTDSKALDKNMDNKKEFEKLIWSTKTNISKQIKYVWSNQDIMTNDSLPLIGEIEKNLYIGTGYNTWGMTNGTIAGKIIADLITNKDSDYKSLFDPKRDIKNLPTLMGYNLENMAAFSTSYVNKNKNFYSDNVKFVNEDGIDIGIYIDEKGKEHRVRNLCPHMKCKLMFNEVEKTWDCPCHGSRFDIDGNVVKGPATYSIKLDKRKK